MNTNQDLNKIAFNNTIATISDKVNSSRNAVEKIAEECEYFASQIKGDEFVAIFNALSKCKTRKAMNLIISGI